MSGTIQIVVAACDIIAVLYICNLVRIRRLELKYALVWLLVGVLLLIFDIRTEWLEGLARLLGITLPINMLFFLGFGFVLMIIFSQTVVISNLTRKSKKLTQEVALLNKRIDDMVESGVSSGQGVFLDQNHRDLSKKNLENRKKSTED